MKDPFRAIEEPGMMRNFDLHHPAIMLNLSFELIQENVSALRNKAPLRMIDDDEAGLAEPIAVQVLALKPPAIATRKAGKRYAPLKKPPVTDDLITIGDAVTERSPDKGCALELIAKEKWIIGDYLFERRRHPWIGGFNGAGADKIGKARAVKSFETKQFGGSSRYDAPGNPGPLLPFHVVGGRTIWTIRVGMDHGSRSRGKHHGGIGLRQGEMAARLGVNVA